MTKKLIHCPKCGKNSFVNLNEEGKNPVKKKDYEKMIKAMLKVPPPKNWKETREKRV